MDRYLLFDWGDTLMRDFPDRSGPMAAWPTVEVMPGVVAALEALHGRVGLAVATNAADSEPEQIRRALARGGLLHFFETIFCYRELGVRKPSAEFYRAILERLELPAEHCCMIGDNFDGDVQAATAVGMRAIWYAPDAIDLKRSDQYRTIRSFESLAEVLRELEIL